MDIKEATEIVTDTMELGKMGMNLLSEEGKKNRLRTQEALQTFLDFVSRIPEKKEIPLGHGYKSEYDKDKGYNQAIDDFHKKIT